MCVFGVFFCVEKGKINIKMKKRKGEKNMRATKKNSPSTNNLTVSTEGLQSLLNSGRTTAVQVGMDAGAKVVIGRRVFWNVSKIQRYLD